VIRCSLTCTSCRITTQITLVRDERPSVRCPKCGCVLGSFTSIAGFIYVLSNPSMPGLVKVGFTERTVDSRIAELSGNTASATPFVEEWSCAVTKPQESERKAHDVLRDFRVNSNREFFRISPRSAIDRIVDALGEDAISSSRRGAGKDSYIETGTGFDPGDMLLAKGIIRQGVASLQDSSGPNLGGFGSDKFR
jgi:hypothetical protein